MLHLIDEDPLGLLPQHIHQMQAFQSVGPIAVLLGCELLGSLGHRTLLYLRETHNLWIESLHMVGNSHQVQGE